MGEYDGCTRCQRCNARLNSLREQTEGVCLGCRESAHQENAALKDCPTWLARVEELVRENERLRERCEELESEHDWVRKKLGVPLGTRMTEGDPCVCGTLHVWESRKDMIPMYETSLKRAKAERDALRKKTIDLEGMLATAHEAGEKLRKERCRKFAVTDGSKQGTCYSFFDHFDVWWDDGTSELGILDLSDKGIRKIL